MSKVHCLCVDDSNRPKEIPAEKWPKKGEEYHITWIYKQMTQPGVKGVELAEFDISMCTPYNSYRLNRFAINVDDFQKLIQMFKDTNDSNDIDVDKFFKELIEKEELILQD